MNRETIKKYKKEFNAWLEGEKIQERVDYSQDNWRDEAEPVWNAECEYRIKPAASREFWINVYESGYVGHAHLTAEHAAQAAEGGQPSETFHVRTVKTYVTFGQAHVHSINGKTLDKDCVAIVNGDRSKVFELFGDKFCFDYSEEEWDGRSMHFYPRGYIEVNS